MSSSCAQWRGDIGAYIVGALNGRAREQLTRHLAACAGCRADCDELVPVRDWLGLLDLMTGTLQPGPAAAVRAREVGSDKGVTVLTPRELDVLELVAHGLSNPDIARRLVLSEHEVHRHLASILRKLNLNSRAAVAAWGARAGLVRRNG